MNIAKLLIGYFSTLTIFLIVDLIWLGVIAKGVYHHYLGNFLSARTNWSAAFLFYALFIIGLMVFVIIPAVEKGSVVHALWHGALFGLIAYSTYELTNLATLKHWPVHIVVIDVAWGALLSAVICVAGFYVMKLIG